MKLENKLEDTLGGKWKGLYGEVVTEDCYKLRSLSYSPDLIIDIGANVGTFTRHAKSIFPQATILAVEPHPENAAHFRKFTDLPDVILLEAALGRGPVYRVKGAANGSGEVYMTGCPGYPRIDIALRSDFELQKVRALSLSTIIEYAWEPGLKTAIKIDCEGAENSIWNPEDLKSLQRMDYIAIELHRYAMDGSLQEEVNQLTEDGIRELSATHRVETKGVHLWARKK